MEFSATRLNRDDWADGAALDEELFDDVFLDPLDGQPDVDVFRQRPAIREERGAGGESESAVCLHTVLQIISVHCAVFVFYVAPLGGSVSQGWGRLF